MDTVDEGRTDFKRPNEEQVNWLLEFLRADLPREKPGRLLDFAWGVHALCSREVFEGPRGITFEAGRYIEVRDDGFAPNLDGLLTLQKAVRAGVDRLLSGKAWALPSYPTRWMLVPHAADDATAGAAGTIERRYDGDTTSAFYASASDLIAEFWPRIRQCQRPACGASFLFRDPRQTYCSKSCSSQVRQERHKPLRRRNHKAEHRSRVAKKLPAAPLLKVGRRTR
jgi:hypothetical protein